MKSFSLGIIHVTVVLLCSLPDSEGKCWEPDPVPNAYKIFIGYPHLNGTILVYKCFENYVQTFGDINRICVDGSYTGLTPSCDIQCGEPKSYYDATVSFGSVMAGSVSTYTCNSDNSVTTTAQCQDNGRWLYNDHFQCSVTNILLGEDALTQDGQFANAVTDGVTVTYYEFVQQMSPGLAVFFEDVDKYYDLFRYVIRFPNTVDSQLHSVQMCFESDSSELSLDHICADTNIVGSPVDLIVNETIPCCFFANLITLQGIMRTNPGILSIHEVELYGRPRIVSCDQPEFVYGADVTTDKSGLIHSGDYSCINGFYQTSPHLDITCSPHNHWLLPNIPPKCQDDPVAQMNSTTISLYPYLFDYNVTSCTMIPVLDKLHLNQITEVEVVIVTFMNIGDIDGIVISTALNGQQRSCTPRYESSDVEKTQSFLCSYNLATSIIIQGAVMKTVCEFIVVGKELRESPLECYRTTEGGDYKGKINYTISGAACDPWTGEALLRHENYCRSFNKTKPWCFINGYSDWEFCPLARCETMCSEREDDFDYVGNLDFTITGQKCRSWDIEDGHGRIFSERAFPQNNRSQAYCRNPGKSQDTAWCYTDSANSNSFHLCSVPTCPTEFYYLEFCNCSTIDPLHLQYMHVWDLRTNDKIEKYNQTIDDQMVQYYCDNVYYSDIFAFTLLHSHNWIRISFLCMMDQASTLPSFISLTSCESSSSVFSSSTAIESSMVTSSQVPSTSTYIQAEFTSSVDISTTVIPLLSTYLYNSTSAVDIQPFLSSYIGIEPFSSIVDMEPSSSSFDMEPSSSSFDIEPSSSSFDIEPSSLFLELHSSSSVDVQPSTITTLASATTTSPGSSISVTAETTNSAVQSTTSSPTTSIGFINSTDSNCLCRCFRNNIFNISNGALQEQIDNLTKGLYVSTAELSSTIRRLTSADDPRPSATYVGSTAILIFTMTFVLVVIPDIINGIQFVKRCVSKEEDRQKIKA